MDRLASQIVAGIVRHGLCLPKNNVWVRDQNRTIPIDDGIYAAVGLVNSFPMSAETYIRMAQPADWDSVNARWDVAGQVFDPGTTVLNYDTNDLAWDEKIKTFDGQPPTVFEITRVQQQEIIQIDFMSRSNAGIKRNWEVLAALRSIYSQQMQELYNFKIMRVPRGFVNTSSAEGSSMLNRYSITFPCFVWYQKTTILDPNGEQYFDDFGVKVYVVKPVVPAAPDSYDNGGNWDGSGRFDRTPPPPPDPGLEVVAEFDLTQEGADP